VIQHVDLGEIVAIVTTDQRMAVDEELQTLGILLGHKGHMPQGK
jgi:hypothetical protein